MRNLFIISLLFYSLISFSISKVQTTKPAKAISARSTSGAPKEKTLSINRTIYASQISGVILDCNIATGTKNGGGTPTDNSAALNAVLAKASADNPIHLIIDGGCALGKALVIPSTGHVAITGHGWSTGFYMLSGANSNAIQNIPGTDIATYRAWCSGGPQSIVGHNSILRDFRVNCNKGIYPNGNCNGGVDGTLKTFSQPNLPTPSYLPDARGTYTNTYLLSGLLFLGVDGLTIDNVWVYDAPTFHINLYHCHKVTVNNCRIEAADPTFLGNTDGVHCNGGCSEVRITNSWFSTGDDAIAFNLDEGDNTGGTDFIVDNCILHNCLNAGRIYGHENGTTRRVSITNVRGTCQNVGWNIGYEGGEAKSKEAEVNHSIYIGNCEIQITKPNFRNSMVWINSNAGFIEVAHCKFIEPTMEIPFILMGSFHPVVSTLKITDCAIHRNSLHPTASYGFLGWAGNIGELIIDGFTVTEQNGKSFYDMPALALLIGTNVGKLTIDGSMKGVGRVLDIRNSKVGSIVVKDLFHQSNSDTGSVYSITSTNPAIIPISVGHYNSKNVAGIAIGNVSLTGPGLISSGFAFQDDMIGNNTMYRSWNLGALAYKDPNGDVNKITMPPYKTLKSGTLKAGTITGSTVSIIATEAMYGSKSNSYKWYRSTSPGNLGTPIENQNSKTLVDNGLSSLTTYYYTLKYTDGSLSSVYSDQLQVKTGK